MRPDFDNFAFRHSNESITVTDCGKSVSNNNYCSAGHDLTHIGLNDMFTFVVESTGCFVEDEYPWIRRQSPSNCDTLTLAAREIGASLFDLRVVP